MVVVKISLQTFPQMIVIHDDQVIKTFPPDAPDESFAISIFATGTDRRLQSVLDPKRKHSR